MFTVLVFALLLVACGSDSLTEIHRDLGKYYDALRPPLQEFQRSANRVINQNAYHSKRCALVEVGSAVRALKSNTYDTKGQVQCFTPRITPRFTDQICFRCLQAALVSTPCIFSDSLGNWLSNYLESILCARVARVHYMAVAKVWEPATNDTPSAFVSRLPSFIQHTNPVTQPIAAATIESVCLCPSNCHERANALWTKGIPIIKPILHDALNHHYRSLRRPTTTVQSTDLSNVAQGTTLPFVPDTAVHYRCGDNFVGHYGFLPFSVFQKFIPAGTKTIYVLADKRGRKTDGRQHRAAKCDAIFSALFDYLRAAFPQASIVIRRGDDLYHDLLRLAFAKTTICSVSTFCLWPAVANNHTAYFPQTKLVVRGDTSLDLGFKWITQPQVVPGAPYEFAPTSQLVSMLLAK
jgi:hypothetical protein